MAKDNDKQKVEESKTDMIANMYGASNRKKQKTNAGMYTKAKPTPVGPNKKVFSSAIPISQKTVALSIGDQRVEVVNPSYVDSLERTVHELEKKVKHLENNVRRQQINTKRIADDLNSTKRNMPKWD